MGRLGRGVATAGQYAGWTAVAVATLAVLDLLLGERRSLVSRSTLLLGGAALVALVVLEAYARRSRATATHTGDPTAEPVVGDHVQPLDDDFEDGVYRVVGVDEHVTLLRVTDAAGRRRHTGQLRRIPVDAATSSLQPATNPDAVRTPVEELREQFQGLYWSVRRHV